MKRLKLLVILLLLWPGLLFGASTTIHDMTGLTTPVGNDELPIWDTSAGLTKKITRTNLLGNVYGIRASDYNGDFDAAVTAIGATVTTLFIDQDSIASAITTCPDTLKVEIMSNYTLTATGITVTFNGPLINNGLISGGIIAINNTFAGQDNCFVAATTTVSFSPRSADYYKWQWFGNGTVESGYLNISVELQELADSMPTITAATDAEEGPGTIFIGEGRYIVNGVDIQQGVNIQGASTWSTMLFWNDENYSIRVKKITNGAQPITTISGINFRGGGDAGDGTNRLANIYSGTYGGDGLYSTQIHVRDCWLSSSYMGISFNGTTDCFIHDNVWDGNVSAITLTNTTENKIYNNEFYGLTRSAIIITETNKTLDRINYIYNNHFQEMESGAIIATDSSTTGLSGRLVVRNNEITLSATKSIYSTNAVISIDYMDEVFVQGNIIKSENATKAINGIYINHIGSTAVISDNRVEGTQQGIILTNGVGEFHNDYKIFNNNVLNIEKVGIKVLTGCDGTIVSENNIHNCNLSEGATEAEACGLYITSNKVLVSRNVIGDMKIAPFMMRCVTFGTGLFRERVEDNKFFGWTTGLLPVNVSTSEVIQKQKTYAASASSGIKETLYAGDIIWDSNVTTGNPLGWICTGAGTQSSIGTLSGGINSGSSTLTLTADAPASLTLGSYITIAGVTGPHVVKWIDGASVYITPAADATVAGANVTSTAPTLVTMANAA